MAGASQKSLESVLFVYLLDWDHDLVLEFSVRREHNLILHFQLAASHFVESQRGHAALCPAEDHVLAEHALRIAHLFFGPDDI